ncbi:MAG: Cna B-type domain-containing protein [Ruminococcus sp.]|nr:Cna B-type domain-containing protein [Ruminococcus sp.]
MKRFQYVIQKYVTNHQKHKKYLAAVLALSILVSFAVPFSLIMPAISMTDGSDKQSSEYYDNGNIMTLSAETEYPDAVDITSAQNFILSINAKDTERTNIYYAEKENGSIIGNANKEFPEVTGDTQALDFNLYYKFDNLKDVFSVNGNKRYMYVETVNPKLVFNHVGDGTVEDPEYGTAGTYTFKDGYILIELNDGYINHINTGGGMVEGTLHFEGTLSRDENGSGEQKFEIAGQEVPVKFSSRHPEFSKNGGLTEPADGTITWQVNIHNTYKIDLSEYVLTDTMFANGVTDVKFSPLDVGSYADNQITFNDSTKGEEWITITYKTPIGNHTQGDEITNEATLKRPDNSEEKKNGKVYLEKKPVVVDKYGSPDYNNRKIKWTITVTSNYGESLDGYVVEDSNFPTNDSDIRITNASFTRSNGNLLLSGTTNPVTIEYETTATEGENTNNVYVKKDNEEKDKKENVKVDYKKKSDLVGLNKQGTYNADDREVEWTITITPENGYYLNDYELTDSQFPNNLDNFTFIGCDKTKVTLDSNNHKLKFNSDSNVSGIVTIKYKTTVELPENAAQTTAVSNDIDDNHRTSTTVVTVNGIKARKSVSKSATGTQWQEVYSNGIAEKTIGWKASITSDGTFARKTYTDTLSVDGDGAKHTINESTANFVLTAKSKQNGSTTTLVKGTDYTVDIATDSKSFTITFSDNFDSKYNYVDITYNTVAELGSEYATYKFENDAEFDGTGITGTGPSYSIERKNPKQTTETNIDVWKWWSNNVNDNDKIPVTFKLQYRTDADNNNDGTYAWHDVHGSGENYLFEDSTGYGSASAYLINLSSSDNWTKYLSHLPKSVSLKDENGTDISGSTVNYLYRVVEQKPDGSYAQDSGEYFEKNGGIYVISYDNNFNYGAYSGSMTVTNAFYKNIDITPEKKWDNAENCNVNSITVELQKRVKNSGNTWEKVVTSTLTKDNDWKFSDADKSKYKNLVTAEIKDGQLVEYEYQVVETEIGGTAVGSDRKVVVSNGYIEVANSGTITSDKTATITNTFHETKSLEFEVVKSWLGDADNSSKRTEVIIELQKKSSADNKWVKVEEITLTSEKEWKYKWTGDDLISQYIDPETKAVTTYTYRAMEVGYIKDGKEVRFANPEANGNIIPIDANSYYEVQNDSSGKNTDGELKIQNTFKKLDNFYITPIKRWIDDSAGVRPQKVKFQLQRRFEGEDDDAWKDYENPIELSGDSNYWNGTLQEVPMGELVNGKVKLYEYRFKEIAYVPNSGGDYISIDGTSFKVSGTDDDGNSVDGRYSVTSTDIVKGANGAIKVDNTFKKDVGITKHLLGNNGSELPSSIDIEDLEKFKHGDYYIFNWAITYDLKDWGSGDKLPTIKDTLPDGFELCTDVSILGEKTEWSGEKYAGAWAFQGKNAEEWLKYWHDTYQVDYFMHPSIAWVGANFGCLASPIDNLDDLWSKYKFSATNKGASEDLWYYYDTTKNPHDVYFNKNKANAESQIYYAIKIKCDDLDAKLKRGTYTITNTAYTYDDDGNNTGDTEGSLTIVNNVPTGLMTKEGTEYETDRNTGNLKKSSPGYYNFSIDVNPEGKNLSNGDTIDIEDIFETTGYFDSDKNGGYWTYDDNLIDVLMNKISISEVDANGNKTPLDKSDYVLEFDNTSVENGTALIKLTVPDEKHLVIDYTYKMIANANTPSVINGCKSDVVQKGKYLTMQPGFVPPAGDKISFKNTASLKSDNASDTAKFEEKEYQVFKSSGTINTNRLPKIIKVNTGNYSINNLQANFLIAQYNQSTGKWKYATAIDQSSSNGSSREAKITAWSAECDGLTVPDDAEMIDVQTEYQIEVNLSQNALYKLVEVKVPQGYEGSNLGLSDAEFRTLIVNYLNSNKTDTKLGDTDYENFLENYVSTYYFVYNSVLSSYPDGINAKDVIQVKQGGDVEIPNNQLINIGVGKEWIGSNPDDSIKVQLYWSYTKNTSEIPGDAKVAKAADLGIMTEFKEEKTLKMSEFNDEKIRQNVWTNLPNGKDGKPIYYYIKETAYTLDGKIYTLDEKDGNYKYNGENGTYYPIYVGNAVNVTSENGTPSATVQIKNTQTLVLKKAWKDSNNNPLTKGVPESITVSIYGTDKETNEETLLFEEIELSGDKWETNITEKLEKEDGTSIDLSKYKSFRAEESGIDPSDYTISCVVNLNSNAGEITITNKSKKATSKSVTVDKVWSDGADVHENDSIKVSLYQSTEKITNLTALTQDDMQKKVKDFTLMQDTDDVKYTVELNSTNGWSYTWTGLPMDDEENDVEEYFYYVIEDMTNMTDSTKYTASYTAKTNGAKTEFTVKNTRHAIKVHKEWYDSDGELIPNEFIDEDGIATPNVALDGLEIELKVSKKVNTTKPNPMVIHTFGDSITFGNGYNESGATYASNEYLGALLKSSAYGSFTVSSFGWNSNDSTNTSEGGQKISYLDNKNLNDRDNVICIMLGTNNIIQNTAYGSDSSDADLKGKIATLLGNPEDDNYIPRKLFLASIPDFNYTSASSQMPTWSEWTRADKHGFKGTNQEIENQINNVVAIYNEYVKNVVTELKSAGYDAYFVDVNSVINKDTDLYDGCHLNTKGVDKMAKAFAEAINSSYTVSDTENAKTIELNSENNWTAVVDVEDDGEYYVTETMVTLDGVDITSEWIASYEDNGQKAESKTPVTVKNTKTPVPTTSVSIKKIWKGDSADISKRNGIKLELWRTTTPSDSESWEYYDDVDSQHSGVGDEWTYICNELPAKDNLGKTYYYKVVELDMDGYTVSYENPGGVESGTLTLTNTRTISLKFNKIWANSDGNNIDEVTVKVYRSTNPNDVPNEDLPQMFKIAENVSVGVNKDVTVTANKDIASVTVNKENVIEVAYDGRTITIIGKAQGEATITVKDESGETATVNVTVSALEILLNNSDNFTIVAGAEGTLSATLNGSAADGVTFSSDNNSVISVNDSTIKANGIGTATITATVGDVSTTQTITVTLPSDFAILGDKEVAIDDTLNLSIDKNYGTFTWSSSKDSIATVDQDGKVTGISAGEVTITAIRNDGESRTKTITVVVGSVTLTASEAQAHNDSNKIEFNNPVSSLTITINGSDWAGFNRLYFSNGDSIKGGLYAANGAFCIESSTLNNTTLSGLIEGGVTNQYNAHYEAGANGTLTFNFSTPIESMWFTSLENQGNFTDIVYKVKYATVNDSLRSVRRMASMPVVLAEESEEESPFYVDKVTLSNSKGEGWTATLENLPAYAENGYKYYYWAVEEPVGGYTASYYFDDDNSDTMYCIDATQLGNGEITIKNTKVDEGVKMPSTGGKGVKWYYITGIALMLVAAAGILNRRKNHVK